MDDRRPSLVSVWDLLAGAAILLLAVVWLWAEPRLPDPMPVHYTAAGRVDGWQAKATVPWMLFGLPLGVWGLMFGMGAVMARTRAAAEGGASPRVLAPLRGVLTLGFALLMAGAILIPLAGMRVLHGAVVAFFLCMAAGIGLTAREARRALARTQDASCYRLGLFYVNPEDPRLWVEKRFGMGWTLNYARPSAWWVTVLLLLPPVLILALVLMAR